MLIFFLSFLGHTSSSFHPTDQPFMLSAYGKTNTATLKPPNSSSLIVYKAYSVISWILSTKMIKYHSLKAQIHWLCHKVVCCVSDQLLKYSSITSAKKQNFARGQWGQHWPLLFRDRGGVKNNATWFTNRRTVLINVHWNKNSYQSILFFYASSIL